MKLQSIIVAGFALLLGILISSGSATAQHMGNQQHMQQQSTQHMHQHMTGSNEGIGSMMSDLNDMGQNMQQFMEHMNNMMSNKTLMNDPDVKDNVQQMQKHMGSMMDSMNGILNNIEQVQKVQKENPKQ